VARLVRVAPEETEALEALEGSVDPGALEGSVDPVDLEALVDQVDLEALEALEGSVDPGGLEALFLGRLYLFLPFDRVLEHLVWEVHRLAWVRRVFQLLAWELPAYWLGSLWAVREDYFWVAHLPVRTAAGFLEAFARPADSVG